MTLDEFGRFIKECAEQMNSRYGSPVFDEWAVVSLVENRAKVLAYTGPRNDDFLKNFARDLGTLRSALVGGGYGPGDFEFARHGTGTGYELRRPLGITIVGGLILSQLLTLYTTPVVYLEFDRLRLRMAGKTLRHSEPAAEVG